MGGDKKIIFLQVFILIFTFFDGQAQSNVKTGNIRGCDTWNFPTQTPNTLNNTTIISGTEIQSNNNTASVNIMGFQNNSALVLNGSEAVDFGTTTDAGICTNFIENTAYDIYVGRAFEPGYIPGGNYNSQSTSAITGTGTVKIEFTCNIGMFLPQIKCYYFDGSSGSGYRIDNVGTRLIVTVKLYRQRGGTSTNLATINFTGNNDDLSFPDVNPISQTVIDNVIPGDRFYMSWSAVNVDGNTSRCFKVEVWYSSILDAQNRSIGHLKISPISF